MAAAVPPGFVDLQTASMKMGHDVNIMGVATDVMPSVKSKGSDYMCSFTLADTSFSYPGEGLRVRFFNKEIQSLPKFQGTGDVVILRGVKIKSFSGMTIALSSYSTTWLVFPANSIPKQAHSKFLQIRHEKDPRVRVVSTAQMLYAVFLCNSQDRSTFKTIAMTPAQECTISVSEPAPAMPLQRREKFSLIKDLQIDRFYDLVGQVVKIYPSNDCVELSITDYTANQLLYNYEWGGVGGGDDSREGDEFNYTRRNLTKKAWPGPFGRMTLMVTLWPPHSYFAQSDVKEQQFVLLQNVRIKFSKDAKVEGSMHTDARYSDKIGVVVLKDFTYDRVKNVLRRKLEYSKKFKVESERFIEESRNQKRKQAEPSKRARKKVRKQQKEQLKEQKGREGSNKNVENEAPHAMPVSKSNKQELNRNIQCSHPAVPPRALSSILSLTTHASKTENGTPYTLPFQNMNCRTTVRIIDFWPPDLADFAVRCRRRSEFDVLSEIEDNDTTDDQSDGSEEEERGWEWRFGLVLEDAMGSKHEKKETMKVYVADKDADFLLKLSAENLRASPQALDTLREKLFLLWGDLEERKSNLEPLPSSSSSSSLPLQPAFGNKQPNPNPSAAGGKSGDRPKSMPFQCCIKEYGIRARNRRRADADADAADSDVDDENEDEDGQDANHTRKEKKTTDERGGNLLGWERRWRMWGVTIS
ncbi:hypothetical protein MMC07_004368 [Pseudocyphellaria aurata]|nr:hypothetical protein [Pseudocyphellaria aurata]